MESNELVARALCRQYNRGFEDATDDNPYGGEEAASEREKYIDSLVEDNWREWIEEAQALLDALRPREK